MTLETASECIQKRVVRYDKTGDQHYDTISAFIKSMRGSDPDAAVYYLAKMLYAGEDIKFIARRMMICAAEDVGNADPQALHGGGSGGTGSGADRYAGSPADPFAGGDLYCGCAEEQCSGTNAIFAAMESVQQSKKPTVPVHLQDAHYKGSAKLGHGIGYKYAHDYPKHYVKQQYLPDEIRGERFYEPTEIGYEERIKERLERLRHREE